jgi:hypothetical protein
VVRSAGAIVPNSRTLLTEVRVLNRKGELLPGSFGEVKFHIALPHAPLVIPANALLFRSKGTQVALVTQNLTVHLQNVALGSDFGTSAEVVSGLTPQDSIIVNPSDSISEGTQVTIVVPKAAPQGAGQQGAAPNAAATPK